MKALLVYPFIPDTFWSFKHILKFISKKAAHVPLGLLTIAGMMPREWDIRVVDMNVDNLPDEFIDWADMVFISAMIVQKTSAREVIDRCHARGKAVVAGGPLFISARRDFQDVDHLVLNEGEVTFPLFLEDLSAGTLKHTYESDEKPCMSLTPLPRWDLIDIHLYASLSIQYSRGCPFNCEFCDIVNLNGRVPRVKSPDQMVTELDLLYRMGWRGRVFIVDDNFIGNKVKAKEMLRRIGPWHAAKKYPFTFYTEASVNLADDEELLNLMSDAGFDCVFLGLETPDEDSLRECGKFQNSGKDLVEAVKTIQAHGMEVMGGFIIGFDSDPPNIFERQIKFIQTTGVVKAMIGLLNALPGTRLYERLQKEGRLLSDDLSGDNCDGSMNFVPKMDLQTVTEGYQNVLRHIYSPKHYYQRVLAFLDNYRPARPRRVDWMEMKAFLRSILYLGILDKGMNKLYYWKLLIKAFLFHRKAFGEAVSGAIFGYHFRKLLDSYHFGDLMEEDKCVPRQSASGGS